MLKKFLQKKIGKLTTIALSGVVGASLIINAYANNDVQLSVNQYPDIDVVVTKGRSNVNLLNFENDLKNSLQTLGIPKEKVKVQSIETSDVNISTAFDWKQDVSSAIGSISITNNGQSVVMKGNKTKPGKNAIWAFPTIKGEQEFNMNYSIDFGDSFNSAGMLLKVKEENNTLTGYMLSFNNSNWSSSANNKSGAIWKFTYPLKTNTTNMQKTLVQSLSINKSGKLNVIVEDDLIKISGGGLSSPVTVNTEAGYGGDGFGFFSDHYSHNCSSIGNFSLTGLNLGVTTVKKFTEVIRQPEWRNDSIRVIVNANDLIEEDFNNPDSLGEILTRTINEEIHYVAWGNSVNESQFRTFIKSNNNNGTFVSNTNYNNAIKVTAEYIRNLLNKYVDSQYVIVNQPANITVNPQDLATNTQTPDFPNGRWRIEHDYEYFENGLGQASWAEQWQKDLTMIFDKVGKFDVYFANNLIKTIYSHRLPVADFIVRMNGTALTLTSSSYDLDEQSKNNGIAQEEWKWKEVTANDWTDGKLTNIQSGKTYIVQLRVKDHQGAWSAPTTKYVSNGGEAVQPIASFTHAPNPITIYERLNVNDSSYDPKGYSISEYEWIVTKDGIQKYKNSTPLINYQSLGVGEYIVSLRVKNSANLWSETFSRPLTVTADYQAPEVIINPTNCDWATSQVINLKFSDKGGSGFKNWKYTFSNSVNTPTTGWSALISDTDYDITHNTDGQLYIHIKAYDNAGNEMNRYSGLYKIDLTPPVISYELSNTNWTNKTVNINITATDTGIGVKDITLPNGETVNGNKGSYPVNKNGIYSFVATDYLNNQSVLQISVANIDLDKPKVTIVNNTNWTNQDVKVNITAQD